MSHLRSREARERRKQKHISFYKLKKSVRQTLRQQINDTSYYCRVTKETVSQTSSEELESIAYRRFGDKMRSWWIPDVEHGEVLRVGVNGSGARFL